MKTIKKLTFGTLATVAALAAALLFLTSITQADDKGQRGGGHGQRDDDHERGDRDRNHRDAKITFTKWVTDVPNQPGLIANMEGLVDGGAAGEGIFTGEVLKWDTSGPVIEIVALYHFTGSKHAFTAVVHVTRPKTSPVGAIVGVVTDGWLKGHALTGEWTTITVGPNPFGADLPVPYIPVTLEIDRDSND